MRYEMNGVLRGMNIKAQRDIVCKYKKYIFTKQNKKISFFLKI